MIPLNGTKILRHARRILACLIFCTVLGISLLRAQTTTSMNVGPSTEEAYAEQHGGYIRNRGNSKVIVFVHGLFSDPEVWRCDSDHYWPEMIANDEDPVFANTDIYVAKYPTPHKGGKMTLADIASNLNNQLVTYKVFSNHKQVIFVAHSMGGILTQELLITYVTERLSDQVQAIFLYGTPDEGSKLANVFSIFSEDPLLKELKSGDSNFILPDMDLKWHHSAAAQIKRYCAYETRPEDGFKVVSRDSATRGCDDWVAIDADHHHLVEPCSTSDTAYTWLANKLKASAPKPEPTAPSPTTPSIRQTPATSTPYSEVGEVLQEVSQIHQHLVKGVEEISKTFAGPYKRGKEGPMPEELPPDLFSSLVLQDRAASTSYADLMAQIMKAHGDAVECFQLTPNAKSTDKATFDAANDKALRTTPIDQLGLGRSAADRFLPIIDYLSTTHDKLGYYRCGMYQ